LVQKLPSPSPLDAHRPTGSLSGSDADHRRRLQVLRHPASSSPRCRSSSHGPTGSDSSDRNGAGKSTLFRLILGEERPDTGTIEWERGADFGFLPQESAPAGEETILHIATSGKKLEPDEDDYDIDYTLEPRARKISAGLGFKEGDAEKPAKTFSGGWVMRAHLARLLVAEPALLLLDEPTNHLDLEALLWFQDYLTRYPGGLVVISHDRAFLNALCTGMLEMRGGTLHYYHGNYDNFLLEKEARKAQQAARYKNQQREIAHLQKFVDRFGAKASLASRAKSKEKQIERLQENAIEEPTEELKRINFKFPQPPRSGLKVIELEHVEQAYGEHVVYRDLNFTAERGQRIVLVGPNGAGKSTLLKILAGVLPIRGGSRELGGNVVVGYFAQNRLDNLRPELSVFENVMELRTNENQLTEQQARAILGAFLFRKDDVHKPIGVLSGGEKSRLALARMLAEATQPAADGRADHAPRHPVDRRAHWRPQAIRGHADLHQPRRALHQVTRRERASRAQRPADALRGQLRLLPGEISRHRRPRGADRWVHRRTTGAGYGQAGSQSTQARGPCGEESQSERDPEIPRARRPAGEACRRA
jgi:ATPase subunit of ABC transporter with duplicated ATPase domains